MVRPPAVAVDEGGGPILVYHRGVRGFALLLAVAVIPIAACDPAPAPAAVDAGPPAEVASSDLSAPRNPPALRVPHPPVPALPDLPALSAHAAPSNPPPGANLDG